MQPRRRPPSRSQRRSATRTLAGFALVATAAISGCGLVPASPPIAPDVPFEGDFAAATEWVPIKLAFPNGAARLEVAGIDLITPRLRQYFSLAVRPIDENAVSVEMPADVEGAGRSRVLVTVSGAIAGNVAGRQLRVWVARTGSGWGIEPQAEMRTFCSLGLGGLPGQCAGG